MSITAQAGGGHVAGTRTCDHAGGQDGEPARYAAAQQHQRQHAELAGRYQACAGVSARGDHQHWQPAYTPAYPTTPTAHQ